MTGDLLADLRLPDVLAVLQVSCCGSVSCAARALNVTPSQVSKAIARLEMTLGVRLLVRQSRGVSLSELGTKLVRELQEIVTRLRSLTRDSNGRAMELTIAAPSYLSVFFLPLIAEAHPQCFVRGIAMLPALLRAFASQSSFDVALTIGEERCLPRTALSTGG